MAMVASCRALATVVGLALAGHALPAHAQKAPWAEGVSEDNKAKAKTLLDAGNALLLDKKYPEALAQYEAAVKLYDHPAIRFNMVRCLIQLGRNLDAYASLELALKYGAAPHEETVYNEAVAYQKLLATQIGELTVSCDQPGVALTIDGKPFAVCPTKQSTRVLAGAHQIVGTKAGLLPKTVELAVSGGQSRDFAIKLDPLEAGARIEHRWPQYVPWTVFGGGLLVTGAGALFQVLGSSQMEDYDKWVDTLCTSNCQPEELADVEYLRNGAELKSQIGVSLMVTGGVAIAAGAVMVFLNRGRTVYPTNVEVAPIAGGGGAVSWRGSF